MLTKQDLNAIGNLIDSKLEEKLESKLEEKLESKLEEKLEKKLKPIRKSINRIQATLDTAIDHFNARADELKKAVKQTRNEAGFEGYNFIY